jgi:hypothetical protein
MLLRVHSQQENTFFSFMPDCLLQTAAPTVDTVQDASLISAVLANNIIGSDVIVNKDTLNGPPAMAFDVTPFM